MKTLKTIHHFSLVSAIVFLCHSSLYGQTRIFPPYIGNSPVHHVVGPQGQYLAAFNFLKGIDRSNYQLLIDPNGKVQQSATILFPHKSVSFMITQNYIRDRKGRTYFLSNLFTNDKRTKIFRSLPNGRIDTSFGKNGVLTMPESYGRVATIAVDGFNNLYFLASIGNTSKVFRIRNGKLDQHYKFPPIKIGLRNISIDLLNRVVASYVRRESGTTGPIEIIGAMRFKINGSLDRSFGQNGVIERKVSGESFNAQNILIGKRNSVYILGGTWETKKIWAWKLGYNGKPVKSYGQNGLSLNFLGKAIEIRDGSIDSSGRLLFSGARFRCNWDPTNNICQVDGTVIGRLNQDGSIDKSIAGRGYFAQRFSGAPLNGESATGEGILIDRKGRITSTGFAQINGKETFFIRRYLPDFKPDPSFGNNGLTYWAVP